MSKQMKALAITMALSSGILYSMPLRGAEIPGPPALHHPEDETQQLLRDRDDAAPKARAAQTKLREAGVLIDSMGFDSARSTRDQKLSAATSAQEKLAAYDRYAKIAKRLEGKVQSEVKQGLRGVDFSDIARFERLQAEGELAEAKGRLGAARQELTEIPSYEQALLALQSERRKLKAGKSELLVVHRVAADLRDAELQMSSTEP